MPRESQRSPTVTDEYTADEHGYSFGSWTVNATDVGVPQRRRRRIGLTDPAPTMTTRCTSPSCGQFVHPTEHRAISLREAALLQTFPASYQFCVNHESMKRQIGNAVPVRLAHALGLAVRQLLGHTRAADRDSTAPDVDAYRRSRYPHRIPPRLVGSAGHGGAYSSSGVHA